MATEGEVTEAADDVVWVVTPTSVKTVPRCIHMPKPCQIIIGVLGTGDWTCPHCADDKRAAIIAATKGEQNDE